MIPIVMQSQAPTFRLAPGWAQVQSRKAGTSLSSNIALSWHYQLPVSQVVSALTLSSVSKTCHSFTSAILYREVVLQSPKIVKQSNFWSMMRKLLALGIQPASRVLPTWPLNLSTDILIQKWHWARRFTMETLKFSPVRRTDSFSLQNNFHWS